MAVQVDFVCWFDSFIYYFFLYFGEIRKPDEKASSLFFFYLDNIFDFVSLAAICHCSWLVFLLFSLSLSFSFLFSFVFSFFRWILFIFYGGCRRVGYRLRPAVCFGYLPRRFFPFSSSSSNTCSSKSFCSSTKFNSNSWHSNMKNNYRSVRLRIVTASSSFFFSWFFLCFRFACERCRTRFITGGWCRLWPTGIYGTEEKDGRRSTLGTRATRKRTASSPEEQGEARTERCRLFWSQTKITGKSLLFVFFSTHVEQNISSFKDRFS